MCNILTLNDIKCSNNLRWMTFKVIKAMYEYIYEYGFLIHASYITIFQIQKVTKPLNVIEANRPIQRKHSMFILVTL